MVYLKCNGRCKEQRFRKSFTIQSQDAKDLKNCPFCDYKFTEQDRDGVVYR